MSRQRLVVIVIIIVSILIGGFIGFYFYLHNKGVSTGAITSPSNGFFGFFGGGNTTNQNPSNSSTSTVSSSSPSVIIPAQVPRLRLITISPVGGGDFVIKNIYATTSTTTKTAPKLLGTQEVIRWIERATGNIFETSTSSLSTTRISNTTIPQIYEAFFTDKGDSVIIRGLVSDETDTIQSQFGKLQTISPTSTEQNLTLSQLPLNITSMALSPDKTKIFSITPTNPRGQISRTDGGSKVTVFNSPFDEWLADWPTTQTVVLTTKPSGTTAGFAYALNTQTQSFTRLVGNINGLTTLLSPDGNKLLYSQSTDSGGVNLFILDRKSGASSQIFTNTLPEKCIWSKLNTNVLYCAVPTSMPFATYPDLWYQGLVSFSDTLWKIDTLTGQTTQILRPLDYTDAAIDMINLKLSQKEDYITFQNKSDLSLWGYQLVVPQTSVATTTASTTSH